MAPTAAALAAFAATCKELRSVVTVWEQISGPELTALNGMLKAHGRPAIATPAALHAPACS